MRSESEIRERIEQLENDLADYVFPATMYGSENRLALRYEAERDALYFALGERVPHCTPVYMFDFYRKRAGGAV